jgi:hypothetical protein
MKIYVASSWRNSVQDVIVPVLRAAGHEVYDFKNPAPGNSGFAWNALDGSPTSNPRWKEWKAEEFREHLKNPIAAAGFKLDMDALRWSDACVLVLPCGRSAHLELGWAAGAGKKSMALMMDENGPHEPELMYLMLDAVCTSQHEMISTLEKWDRAAA